MPDHLNHTWHFLFTKKDVLSNPKNSQKFIVTGQVNKSKKGKNFQYIAKIIIPNNLLMLNKDAFIVHNMARCQTANSTSNTREPTRYTCTSNLLGPQTTFSFRCFMLVAWNCQNKKTFLHFLLLVAQDLHIKSSFGEFPQWSILKLAKHILHPSLQKCSNSQAYMFHGQKIVLKNGFTRTIIFKSFST